MHRRVTPALLAAAILCLGIASAQAGPCSSEIAWFEQKVRQSAGNPYAGLFAPQSIDAQLNYQPTKASVRQSQQQLRATFAAIMARAKRLDARGDRVGCEQALDAAKRMYILP